MFLATTGAQGILLSVRLTYHFKVVVVVNLLFCPTFKSIHSKAQQRPCSETKRWSFLILCLVSLCLKLLFPPLVNVTVLFSLFSEPNIWLCNCFLLIPSILLSGLWMVLCKHFTCKGCYVFNFWKCPESYLRHLKTVNIYFGDGKEFAASHFILFIPWPMRSKH